MNEDDLERLRCDAIDKIYEEINNASFNRDKPIDRITSFEHFLLNLPLGRTLEDLLKDKHACCPPEFREELVYYAYMTDDERMLYHYIFSKQGVEEAKSYLATIQQDINQRQGLDDAIRFVKTLDLDDQGQVKEKLANLFGVSVKGLDDGMNNFREGLIRLIEDDTTITADEYQKMFILQYLHENSDYYDDVYEGAMAIENLCYYELNGQQYNYRQAMDIVNKAKSNNQTPPKFRKVGTQEYFCLKSKLTDMGFSTRDASVVLSSVNDAGACSYAAVLNEILYKFRNDPAGFERVFGFPMYQEDGVTVNSAEMLLDLYLFANTSSDGQHFINADNTLNPRFLSDRIDVFGRNILDAKMQQFPSNYYGKNQLLLDSYLKSKDVNLSFEAEVLFKGKGKYDSAGLKAYLTSEIETAWLLVHGAINI